MKIALSTVLVVSTILAPAAIAQDHSTDDSPEGVVRAVYGLISFDPTSPIDRESFGKYFADDALVGFGTSLEDVAVMSLGTFIDQVEERVRSGDVGGVGHTVTPEEVECSPVGDAAMCFVRYRFGGRCRSVGTCISRPMPAARDRAAPFRRRGGSEYDHAYGQKFSDRLIWLRATLVEVTT